MKKRTTMLVIATIIAFSLLGVTAFANAPTYEGYEALKALMENQKETEMTGGTLKGSLTISESGKQLVTMSTDVSGDKEQKAGSGVVSIESDSVSRLLNVYFADEQVYVFDEANQEYYKINKADSDYSDDFSYDGYDENSYNRGDYPFDRTMTPAQEELLDFIVGELKDDFTVEHNGDGSQTIGFELTSDEMPVLLNLMISAGNSTHKDAFRETNREEINSELLKYPLFAQLSTMCKSVPEIVDNFKLNRIDLEFTTDADAQIKSVSFDVDIAGTDKNGNNHNLQLTGQFAVDKGDIGSITVPDLNGKTIIELDPSAFDNKDKFSDRQRHF